MLVFDKPILYKKYFIVSFFFLLTFLISIGVAVLGKPSTLYRLLLLLRPSIKENKKYEKKKALLNFINFLTY